MFAWIVHPAVIGIAALFLAVLWMLRDESDRTRPLLVMALVLNLAYGAALHLVMGTENGLTPWKYDYILAHLDAALGTPPPGPARALRPLHLWLFAAYQLMVPMMIGWFLVARRAGQARAIILSYVTEMVTGPLLYALVPACGPVYAFGKGWLHPAETEPVLVRLSGMPNAFPSLHLGTALVLVLFAPGRWARVGSLAFLAATAMATLSTGEHYVIDLVAGLAFGCFAASAGRRQLVPALTFGALALAWTLGVRMGYGWLLTHPAALRWAAALTVASAGVAVATAWRGMRQSLAAGENISAARRDSEAVVTADRV